MENERQKGAVDVEVGFYFKTRELLVSTQSLPWKHYAVKGSGDCHTGLL
jgi:hypothetical protein